jgi:hypothetical protein
MKTFAHRFIVLAQAMFVLLMLALGGCGRSDTRVNSDPGPGRPSRADGGDKAVRPDPNQPAPSAETKRTAGTDSTGRPSDASGGTGGVASDATNGTAEPAPANARK